MHTYTRKGILALVGCSLGILMSGALVFGVPGFMTPHWQEMYRVDSGATGNVTTFILFALGVFMFFSGKWHAKLGTRKSLLVGAAVLVLAMVVLLLATNIYLVYVWAFLNGTASCFFYGPGLTTVQRWFSHKKGLVSGILNCVFGISGAVMLPVFQLLYSRLGYRGCIIAMIGMIVVANGIACCVAELPERSRLSDQDRQAMAERSRHSASTAGASRDFAVKEALKTRTFWTLWLVWVFMGSAGISMTALSVNYAAVLGVSGVVVLGAFNVTNGLSRLIAGSLSDWLGRTKTACIAFLLATIGYGMLLVLHSPWVLPVSACMIGFGFGTLFAVSAPLVSDLFGLKNFGMIFGLTFTAFGFIGGVLGPMLSGYILQYTGGNYVPAFAYLCVFCLLASVLVLKVKKPHGEGQAGSKD